MPLGLQIAIAFLAAALIGSIPFALLIARYVSGIDLRKHGSGNVGATNVARTLGARWGTIALLLDVSKGAIPALFIPMMFFASSPEAVNIGALCGAGAVLGHMFTPWLGFRGGKGVATALGAVAVLAPASTGIALLAFLMTFGASRIVSLASIVASLAFAVSAFFIHGSKLWSSGSWGLGVFALAIPLLIIVRHRANIVRLIQGKEPKLVLGKKSPPPENPA